MRLVRACVCERVCLLPLVRMYSSAKGVPCLLAVCFFRLRGAAMAPKKSTTDIDNEMVNLERRAAERQQKLQKKMVLDSMKANPACLPHLVAKLQAINMLVRGTDGEETQGSGAVPHSRKMAAIHSRALANADAKSSASMGLEAGELPSKCTTIVNWSVQAMTDHILVPCEPVSTSSPNVKKMCRRGSSAGNKAEVAKIVEFSTGLTPDFSPTGDLRKLDRWHAFVQHRHACRGRRTRDLHLPVDWSKQGLLLIMSIEEDVVTIRHLSTREARTFSLKDMPCPEFPDGLYLEFNWSETRVSVANRRDPELRFCVCVAHAFPNQIVVNAPIVDLPPSQPRGQKRRLALEAPPSPEYVAPVSPTRVVVSEGSAARAPETTVPSASVSSRVPAPAAVEAASVPAPSGEPVSASVLAPAGSTVEAPASEEVGDAAKSSDAPAAGGEEEEEEEENEEEELEDPDGEAYDESVLVPPADEEE